MKNRKTISFTKEQAERLRVVAFHARKSISEIVRLLIIEHLDDLEKKFNK